MLVDFRIALRCTGAAFVAVLVVGVILVTPASAGSLLHQNTTWTLLLASALAPAVRPAERRPTR